MTTASSPNSSEPNPLDPIIAAYLEAVERGDKPDRDRLMLDHPQLASELRAFFADLDRVHQAAGKPADYDATVIGMKEPTPGTILGGRYKLLENIGEGGMGSVWVAEQQQPVKRKVAIKLVKAGMDSKQVLARFEAERQALAVMDHPNIAKVFDGGMTDQGRPYFVMEYVKGIPFTEYCDRVKPSLKERLILFIPVCHAVQHAHHKGIVHRDLKPSNILICLYDGKPVPKVIDFGLAKAMHQPLTEKSIHTGHGIMVGTPVYMSPEQAEHNNLDVDTRTDIYSLGVVLYELLVGTTPLERQQLQQAAFDEILRLIKEVEPPRPSVRLSASGSLPSIAAQRSIEPKDLRKSLTGDLDWIVMKSLEKERSRRYDTANGFAQDIERFLNEEPVEACPPSRSYLLKKFVRKHRGQIVAASTVVVALTLGIVASTWFGLHARRSEKIAVAAIKDKEAERLRALEAKRDAETQLLKGILRPIGHGDEPNDAELRSYIDWSAIRDSQVSLRGLEMAFENPDTALRVARRAERVIQACVGLSPTRRAAALAFVSEKRHDSAVDPKMRAAACWLALELGSDDAGGLGETIEWMFRTNMERDNVRPEFEDFLGFLCARAESLTPLHLTRAYDVLINCLAATHD
jgi:serine/threonine protein kinase